MYDKDLLYALNTYINILFDQEQFYQNKQVQFLLIVSVEETSISVGFNQSRASIWSHNLNPTSLNRCVTQPQSLPEPQTPPPPTLRMYDLCNLRYYNLLDYHITLILELWTYADQNNLRYFVAVHNILQVKIYYTPKNIFDYDHRCWLGKSL